MPLRTADSPIIVEAEYHVPLDAVWSAITEVDQMHQWYFLEVDEFEPRIGFKTKFDVFLEDKVYPHNWEVIESAPPHCLSYLWSYDDMPGEGKVTWELTENDGVTHLRLTNEILSDFSDEDPNFTLESCRGGWEYFLNETLKSYLDS